MSQETYWVKKQLMNSGISGWYETYCIPVGNALIKNSPGISSRTGTRTRVIQTTIELHPEVSSWVQKVEPPVEPVKPPVEPVKPPAEPVKPPVEPVKPEKPPVAPTKPVRYETRTITRQIELDEISIGSNGSIDIYLVAKYYYNGGGNYYDSD